MCKHVLNAQVSVRAPCCKRWFDCPECHEEATDHPLLKTMEMAFACKKCKKAFRKDMKCAPFGFAFLCIADLLVFLFFLYQPFIFLLP